jgi:hypothetical protein
MYINKLAIQAFGFQFECNLQFAFGLQCELCFQQCVFRILISYKNLEGGEGLRIPMDKALELHVLGARC